MRAQVIRNKCFSIILLVSFVCSTKYTSKNLRMTCSHTLNNQDTTYNGMVELNLYWKSRYGGFNLTRLWLWNSLALCCIAHSTNAWYAILLVLYKKNTVLAHSYHATFAIVNSGWFYFLIFKWLDILKLLRQGQ